MSFCSKIQCDRKRKTKFYFEAFSFLLGFSFDTSRGMHKIICQRYNERFGSSKMSPCMLDRWHEVWGWSLLLKEVTVLQVANNKGVPVLGQFGLYKVGLDPIGFLASDDITLSKNNNNIILIIIKITWFFWTGPIYLQGN